MLYKIRSKNPDKGTAEQTVFLKFAMYVYLPWWITATVPTTAPCHDLKPEPYQQHLTVQGNKPGGCQRRTYGYSKPSLVSHRRAPSI